YRFNTYQDVVNPSAGSVRLGTATIDAPVPFALPPAGLPTHTNLFLSNRTYQQGVNVGDTVALGRGWSVRGTVSQDWIWTDNYNTASVRTGGYTDHGVSPLVSVLYKPQARMTIYTTI